MKKINFFEFVVKTTLIMYMIMIIPVNLVFAGSNNGNGNDEPSHVKISFNKEELVYDNDLEAYKAEEEVLNLSGMLEKTNQVKKLIYKVENQDGKITYQGKLDIYATWTIPEIQLEVGYSKITVSATRANDDAISESIKVYLDESLKLNFDPDYMRVEDVYSQLVIKYQGNDSELSVTQNVELLTSIEGATISWTSTDLAMVNNNGVITRPENTSAYVTLTATITSGSYTKTKEFMLHVIKNKYENYNVNYIEDANSYEYLYVYNQDDLDKLEVYTNADNKLQFISGSFSDIVVESPNEANLALYGVKTLMECTSPKDELKWVSTNKDAYGAVYRFEQLYKDIPVYGSSVVVGTDINGSTTSLQSSFVGNIGVNTVVNITADEAAMKVKNLGLQPVIDAKLYIYMKQSVPVLVWNVLAQDADKKSYNCLIDANTGSEVYRNTNSTSEFGNTIGSGRDELGVSQSFPLTYLKFFNITNYAMSDTDRNIKVYNMDNSTNHSLLPGTLLSKSTNSWLSDEISSYANTIKCYDFYKNNFGRKGFDNENSEIKVVIRDGSNIGNSYNNGDIINFGTGGSYIYSGGAAADTVGHEYTHGVIRSTTALGSYYQDAPGAINEGYADIFGYFIEGDNDPEWLHREDNTKNARALRNMSNPAEFNQPSVIGDNNYYDFTTGTDDNGGVHKNNTIVSHACYLMWLNGISDKTRLANLWYHSLLLGYGKSSDFSSVRMNVLTAAKNMRMTANEIQIIKGAFDSVGITRNPIVIDGTNTLSGKVVIADTDSVLNNNMPLQGATVKIVRSGSNLTGLTTLDSLKFTRTESDGTFYFTNLVPGAYKLTISNTGYYTTTQMVTLSNTNLDNYSNTIELIPETYSGDGYATGKVKDSVSGVGVAGLKLTVRAGINNKIGDIISSLETDVNGNYNTGALPTGHYCIEVNDLRNLPDGEVSYITNYFNIKVLGGTTIYNQDATVSNTLNKDQLRIVLQWGAAPRDLDSHLNGPTSDGEKFHIYYGNKSYYDNSTLVADLDLDDTSSYGPETTTIYNPVQGVYTFYVYNYSGSPSMSTSGAYVQVYNENNNEPSYTFNVPVQEGRYWTVFTYNTVSKKITPINAVGNSVIN